ncbi:hypothetical protein ACFPYI_04220 [Halomarina salina]|uniref:Zinc ribbon domain-containing protein n=1 Tax=Halomarina salina TaxID=1872699 RepID=A0ABD5RJM4_9EURY|nr:hypothetical protein [Halomarina salina]
MSVLTTLRDTVVESGASEGATETFEYRCARCGASFEESKLKMTRVSCPGCTSTNVRATD